MSELSVGSLSGLAANSYVVDIASGSSLDLSNATDLPASALPAGSILQVVQDVKLDAYSASLGAGAFSSAIPGLSASITPSSTSSKVLVTVAVGGVQNVSGIKLLVNGSDSTYIGDLSGSRGRASSTASLGSSTTIVFLHSPASTSEQTYTIQIQNQENSTTTVYLNTTSVNEARIPTTASSITLMEVAG